MVLAAKLYREDRRGADRQSVSLDATLRGEDRRPLDVTVDQLSATGFRMSCSEILQVGDPVSLGATGLGRHMAHVVRRDGEHYGCRFDTPISLADLDSSAAAHAVVQGNFAEFSAEAPPLDALDQRLRRLRGVVIVAGITIPWLLAIGLWLAFG